MGQFFSCYKGEEILMAYARVLNMKFKSGESLEIFIGEWKNWFPENMPTVLSRTIVRTAENAFLLMATYEKEETAIEAKKTVEQFFKMQADHIHEIIDFHGPVKE